MISIEKKKSHCFIQKSMDENESLRINLQSYTEDAVEKKITEMKNAYKIKSDAMDRRYLDQRFYYETKLQDASLEALRCKRDKENTSLLLLSLNIR